MTYATLENMETRFGSEEITQLSDRDGDDSNDSGVVDGALSEASSEIDSYLGVRYSIPITYPSDNLIRTCCDIARYRLHKDMATDEVERRYKSAISWLKDLSAGRAILTDSSGDPITTGSTATTGVDYCSSVRKFNDETMVNY